MGRDRANLRIDLWGDSHWRSLTHGAQWLYHHLLTSPTLNSCGVADWRTARIAAMSGDVTVAMVDAWAGELEREFFIVVDLETEEACVRSFFRHDGILAQPNPTTGAAREFAGIASSRIRGVISNELNRLREEFPEGFGKSNVWQLSALRTVLGTPRIDVKNPSSNPSPKGYMNPSANPYDTSTSTSTSTEASLPEGEAKLKETRLPKSWAPTASHVELARDLRLDLTAEVTSFRLHAETHDRHAARWNAAFTTWLKKAKPSGASVGRVDEFAWMNA